jgi:ABC-type bacteriocin/lantibiotic exporter with double-glycine peptidase domain
VSMAGQRRRLLAPEVIQTSAMDCGPAALKSLLEGHGVPVSYGRLREACQTDVDGTSIDTLEELACQLGLEAEQVMLPPDHLMLDEAQALPALLVVVLPTGVTHFVLVWRVHGPLVQVMDPGSGRRWLSKSRLLRDVYRHQLQVPANDWLAWAKTEDFLAPLVRRLKDLRVGQIGLRWLDDAVASPDWLSLARLDAATRLVAALVSVRGLRRGSEARRVLSAFLEDHQATATPGQRGTGENSESPIPDDYWSVRPVPAGGSAPDEEALILHGAVLIRVRGLIRSDAEPADTGTDAERAQDAEAQPQPSLSPEVVAALAEPPSRPFRELLGMLHGDGALAWTALALGLAAAASAVVLEALLLRSVLDIGRSLGLVTQRLEAVGVFLVLALALMLVELRTTGALLRLGRRVELRLRRALLDKLPRLPDAYLRSRPISDMAERSHSIQQVRVLPRLSGQLLRAVLSLFVIGAALLWLYPAGAPITVLAVTLAVGWPVLFLPHLQELDLRMRTHAGGLTRFYFDALLGLTALRAHSAEEALRREHESLLVEWGDAGLRLVRATVTLEGLQMLSGFGLAVWLLLDYVQRSGEPAGALLLAYWALYLQVLGEEIALLFRQYPMHRNLTLRLLEPLGAPETAGDDSEATATHTQATPAACHADSSVSAEGVAIALEGVTVYAAGHSVLEQIDLIFEPGNHVAIVGASGAGKSSLLGVLLGLHRPSGGQVLIDGTELTDERLARLRRQTVWVDPAVYLWNRTLLDNLLYGSEALSELPLASALELAELHETLERLPAGLQGALGEGGGRLSGGEGQRVRMARGLLRQQARLVILDEPFRALERSRRQAFLARARQHWRGATLLCVTHDIADTHDFDRVLVIEAGRVVEDGVPATLATDSASRYHALLAAEADVRTSLWSAPFWRRLYLGDKGLREGPRP